MIKRISMKNILSTMVAMLLILALVMLAIYSPKFVMEYTDKQTEQKITTFTLSGDIYKASFSNFSEELASMTKAGQWDNRLQVVQLTETQNELTDYKLETAINNELSILRRNGIIPWEFNVQASDRKERLLISLYSEDTDNELNGIRLWKLRYVAKDFTLEMIMDAYFLKICQFQVTLDTTGKVKSSEDSTDSQSPPKTNNTTETARWWSSALSNYYNHPRSVVIYADYNPYMYEYYRVSQRGYYSMLDLYQISNPNTVLMYFDNNIQPSNTQIISFGIWYMNRKIEF